MALEALSSQLALLSLGDVDVLGPYLLSIIEDEDIEEDEKVAALAEQLEGTGVDEGSLKDAEGCALGTFEACARSLVATVSLARQQADERAAAAAAACNLCVLAKASIEEAAQARVEDRSSGRGAEDGVDKSLHFQFLALMEAEDNAGEEQSDRMHNAERAQAVLRQHKEAAVASQHSQKAKEVESQKRGDDNSKKAKADARRKPQAQREAEAKADASRKGPQKK